MVCFNRTTIGFVWWIVVERSTDICAAGQAGGTGTISVEGVSVSAVPVPSPSPVPSPPPATPFPVWAIIVIAVGGSLIIGAPIGWIWWVAGKRFQRRLIVRMPLGIPVCLPRVTRGFGVCSCRKSKSKRSNADTDKMMELSGVVTGNPLKGGRK